MTSRARVHAVWALLVVATVAALVLGGVGHPAGVRLGAVLTIAIGAAKVAVIGLDFMELRHASRPLRAAFLAWVSTLGLVCLGLVVL